MATTRKIARSREGESPVYAGRPSRSTGWGFVSVGEQVGIAESEAAGISDMWE